MLQHLIGGLVLSIFFSDGLGGGGGRPECSNGEESAHVPFPLSSRSPYYDDDRFS